MNCYARVTLSNKLTATCRMRFWFEKVGVTHDMTFLREVLLMKSSYRIYNVPYEMTSY